MLSVALQGVVCIISAMICTAAAHLCSTAHASSLASQAAKLSAPGPELWCRDPGVGGPEDCKLSHPLGGEAGSMLVQC